MLRSTVARRRAPRRRPPDRPARGRSRLPAAAELAATAALLVAAAVATVAFATACSGEVPAPGTSDGPSAAATAGTTAGPAPGPSAKAPVTTEERLMKERILLLQGYIEAYALTHYYAYPGPGAVRRGGGLRAPLWPDDPWTGEPLRRGTEVGGFTYTVATDRRSYRLVGHLPGGDYEVKGAMPHTGEVAYRHREQEGLSLIRQYVVEWARRHGGLYPPAAEVSREGGVGALRDGGFWPSNPWNHGPMIQSHAVGDFGYEVAADRSWCRLTLHTSPTSDWTLECAPLEQ